MAIKNVSKKFKRIAEIAKKVASLSTYKYQTAAVIVKHGKVLSTGYNTNKHSALPKKYFKHGTVHAETDAIMNCKNKDNLKNADIFVFRLTRNGKSANSRPCNTCTKIMAEYGIRRAYWTIDDFPFWDYDKVSNMLDQIDDRLCWELNGKSKR